MKGSRIILQQIYSLIYCYVHVSQHLHPPPQGEGGAYCYGGQKGKGKFEVGGGDTGLCSHPKGPPQYGQTFATPLPICAATPSQCCAPAPTIPAFCLSPPTRTQLQQGLPQSDPHPLQTLHQPGAWGDGGEKPALSGDSQTLLLSSPHPTGFSLENPTGSPWLSTLPHISRQSVGLPPLKSQFPSQDRRIYPSSNLRDSHTLPSSELQGTPTILI